MFIGQSADANLLLQARRGLNPTLFLNDVVGRLGVQCRIAIGFGRRLSIDKLVGKGNASKLVSAGGRPANLSPLVVA